jgi:aryl-alcohol dehydrogenase-like predicted oxidoreductase
MKFENLNRFWLGGNIFGYSAQEDLAIKILDNAEKIGIGGVDTSSSYSKGRSEAIIGRWLNHDKERRKQLIISTKVGLESYESPIGLGHPDRIIETLNSSLKRLQTDYVDVLFLHAPDPITDISLTVSTFYELMQNGLIKGFGICNATKKEAESYFLVLDKLGISLQHFYIQNYFNWARRAQDYWDDFLEFKSTARCNSVSYGLLARGVFMYNSGKKDQASRKNKNLQIMAEVADLKLKQKFNLISEICIKKGQSLYSYSLAYGYYFSRYSIIGIRTLNQLDELRIFRDNLMPQKDFYEIQEIIQKSDLEFREKLGDPFFNL